MISVVIPAYNEEENLENAVNYYYSYLKKLKGLESQGMILVAIGEGDKPVLLEPSETVPPGSTVR